MKYLTLILLALFLFQASYTQEMEMEVETQAENVVIVEVEAEAEAESVEVEVVEEAAAENWQGVLISDFENNNAQAKDFGAQWVISQMIGDETISNSTSWKLAEINFVQSMTVDNGVTYKVHGVYADENGNNFTGEFIINTGTNPTLLEIQQYSYDIQSGDAGVETLEDGSEVSVGTAESAGISMPVPLWTSQELQEAEAETYAGAWQFIDPSTATPGSVLGSLVDESVAAAIAKGLDDGTLPQGNWSLVTVDYIELQQYEGATFGAKYQFWVTLSDGNVTIAKADIYYVEEKDNVNYVYSSAFWSLGPASGPASGS